MTMVNPTGIKKPYRRHTCTSCNYKWLAPVRFADAGEIVNISQEKTEFCSICGRSAGCSTAWLDAMGKDYFKEGNK